MSLSRKLYFPKSLSFGAIRWSFLALASFIKRNSRRSFHSFSSCSPWASLHESSSVHMALRNLSGHGAKCHPLQQKTKHRNHTGHPETDAAVSPFTNFESACGKSILPAVLIVLGVENSVFVFFRRDVLLPLLLAVTVFTTQPTVITSLWIQYTEQSDLHR